MKLYYVDGEFVTADRAVIPVDDLAIHRGIGVFDMARTYNGHLFFLKEHVKRLFKSAEKIDLKLPWTVDQICSIARQTLSKNKIDEANVRIVVTGGSSPDFITPQGNPRLLVLVNAIPKLPTSWYQDGVKVITVNVSRINPGVKSINYVPATLALKEAKKYKASEAIYLDKEENVLEGTTSNVFAFFNDILVTPGKEILSGITRRVILEITREMFKSQIREIHLSEFVRADEVFITGTNKGLVPVVQVDSTTIGDGKPGEKTRQIMAALERRISRYSSKDNN